MKTLTSPLLPLGLEEHQPIAYALAERGYGYLQFIPPRDLIDRVMQGWNTFLALPWEERMKWRCGNPADWDDGYVPRTPEKHCPGCDGCASPYGGTAHDNKHFFHYRPYLPALLEHVHVDYFGHVEWLLAMQTMYKFCQHAFCGALLELDSYDSGFCFAERFLSLTATNRHVLRLLSYNEPMLPGQVLGKAHVDRNFGTIQVYESHPALVLNLPQGRLNYVPKQNQALMFTGAKAATLTDRRLPAINHAVIVPNDFVPQAEVVPRQSIVFFGHIYPETV